MIIIIIVNNCTHLCYQGREKGFFAKMDSSHKIILTKYIATFNHSSFHNFVQKVNNVNGIWCLKTLITALQFLVENGGMSSG